MSDSVRIALAQLNFLVGDVQGNAARVIAATRHARASLGADLVLFPELTLSGYPPEDLLFHRGFRRQIEEGLARLRRELTDAAVMVGFPEYTGGGIYNSAALIAQGEIAAIHRKAKLRSWRAPTARSCCWSSTPPLTRSTSSVSARTWRASAPATSACRWLT